MSKLAVAYLRVSTATNQDGHGFDRQKQAIDEFADLGRFQLQKIFHEVWGCMSLHYQTAYIFCLIDTQNETVEGLIPSIKLDQGALHTNIHDHAHTCLLYTSDAADE